MGRNWQWSFDKGRQDRLNAEQEARRTGNPIIRPKKHSHDGTMQNQYRKGWCSVTEADIYAHIHFKDCKGRAAIARAKEVLCLSSAP